MIQVQGIKEIQDVLRTWPEAVQHKALQATHADAAIPLVNAAHFLAPVGRTGNLADSIGIERPSIKRANEVGAINVGPRRSGRYKGYHAHLVEFGTKDRGRTGTMPADPFMGPAFEQTSGQLRSKIDEILGRKMVSIAKRKIKSGGGTWLKV